VQHLPPELRPAAGEGAAVLDQPLRLDRVEKLSVEEALRRHDGNRCKAAEELGINASTLYRKMRALQIQPPPQDGRGRRR